MSAPHRAIAARVRELRKRHGWSAERLAQEMTNVGIPWERMIVTKLETGRRSYVTVEEALALAYVLGVALVHLIVPTNLTYDAAYLVTPTTEAAAADMRQWIRGASPLDGQDPRVYLSEVPADEFAASVAAQVGEPGR